MNNPHWQLCVLFLLSFAAGHARDLYRLSSLEGLSVIHTDFGKRVNESGALSASPDKIAGEIGCTRSSQQDQLAITLLLGSKIASTGIDLTASTKTSVDRPIGVVSLELNIVASRSCI